MRKVHALEILRGEKVREYRWYCEHWAKILCLYENPEKPKQATSLRHFDIIHFYPYNGKWYLDVELKGSSLNWVQKDFIGKYGSEVEVEEGQMVFMFELGKVISTNLTEE